MPRTKKTLPGNKKQFKKTQYFLWSKNSPILYILKSALWLLLFFIIKVGQLPAKLILGLPSFLISHFPLSTFQLFHTKRGRPRTQPLIPFYKKKVAKLFNRLFPKSIRLKATLGVFAVVLFLNSLLVFKISADLPSPTQLKNKQNSLTTQILDRQGKLLYQFYEGKNQKFISLSDLPLHLTQATIAIEDKHFYTHPGIDPAGIIRALNNNYLLSTKELAPNDFDIQGGSTITQQLIKNTLLTPNQTLTRKIKEAALAFWTERIYTKEQILEMYLNESPYGGPAWGIETAAQTYFGKSAKDLNLAESAYLAGLPVAPSEYSPYGTQPEKGLARQQEVLRRMVEDGYITKIQADEAALQSLTFQPPASNIKAPHFVMYVRSLLANKYGERAVSQGGLKVITTLDLGLQEMAENAVESEINKLADLHVGNGAAMVTNAQTGEILAMVGSKNYFDPKGGNFNVTTALRQPGSSIKPVTYATAFKLGMSPGQVVLDTPITFTNPWGQGYTPVNYDGGFHGPVTIRTALGSSYNIPAVKILNQVGLPTMLQTAKDMGINTFNKPSNYGLSLTLGGEGVKMIEMMSVYGTLASGGIRYGPQAVISVTDSKGNVLENNQDIEGRQVLTPEVAFLLTDILADNKARSPAFGANSLLKIDGQTVAVKTGTSDDKRDNWTFGFTPQFVVGVWVGNNDYSPMNPKLASGITGAAPIWREIMINLLSGKENLAFEGPSGITLGIVDGRKDLVISDKVSKTVVGFQKVKANQNTSQDTMTSSNLYTILSPSQTTQ